MDGTLLDSMRYWRLGSIEYLLAHQMPVPEDILPGLFTRSGLATLEMAMNALKCEFNKPAMSIEMCARMHEHYVRDVKPKPFALEFVRALRENGVKCCVATATPRSEAQAALSANGFDGMFEFITDCDETCCTKRESEFFYRIARRLDIDAGECALFEDSLYAMAAARETGMWICAVDEPTAINDAAAIRDMCDKYVSDFSALL